MTVPMPTVLSSWIHVHTDKNGNKIQVARDDDKYWKFGFFYYNPEDPRLFIEKRFGIGQTVNWGRPMSNVSLYCAALSLPLSVNSSKYFYVAHLMLCSQ